jgi:pantetheine-phosphate adenylyltransferase
MPVKRFSKVATGGTFDQFHAGHRRLLEKSFELGDQVVIGLTSDEFARRQGKTPQQPYRQRRAKLEAYIRKRFASKGVEALVASPETGKRVELANRLREKRGFPPLELVVVDWVVADDGKPISSSRIRSGEIDEEGRLIGGRRPAKRAR